MSTPKLPIGEGDVPDKALEELLAAFANDVPPPPDVDLDDPSIDLLLGLTPEPSAGEIDPLATQPVEQIADAPITREVLAAELGIEQPVPEPPPAGAPIDAGPADGPATDPPAPAPRKTIQIGGGEQDDLPDAVYLDEEAEERCEARPVGRPRRRSAVSERRS